MRIFPKSVLSIENEEDIFMRVYSVGDLKKVVFKLEKFGWFSKWPAKSEETIVAYAYVLDPKRNNPVADIGYWYSTMSTVNDDIPFFGSDGKLFVGNLKDMMISAYRRRYFHWHCFKAAEKRRALIEQFESK